ncbi:MAG: patatin-like phospholipase family protein [Bryobacteraceae bacterium]|nr:patatin-like phospholipase family protein [Bryobacteraceae bacterium]
MASTPQRKKLLALDGGGIRGVISLGVLAALERTVNQPLGQYFDYIGGTSTGAIIAAGLARGMSVAELQSFYEQYGPAMFDKRFLLRRYKSLYTADALSDQLKKTFGPATTLADVQKPLLLIVTRNWTTDSPWPISSNPHALYNVPTRPDCNLKIPLWQLVRASTAAPVYFPPEVLHWDPADPSKSFVFVDGGVTPYNNPAFLLYRMATVPEYRLGWPTGEDNLLIVSVGTGSAPKIGPDQDDGERTIPGQLPGLISALMYGAEVDQDVSCRTVGRCTYGDIIDRELGDMIPRDYPDQKCPPLRDRDQFPKIPLSQNLGKQFLYARYNPTLTPAALAAVGLGHLDVEDLLRMDLATPQNIRNLLAVGEATGRNVRPEHLGIA